MTVAPYVKDSGAPSFRDLKRLDASAPYQHDEMARVAILVEEIRVFVGYVGRCHVNDVAVCQVLLHRFNVGCVVAVKVPVERWRAAENRG